MAYDQQIYIAQICVNTYHRVPDGDPGLWDPCAVAAIDKYTWITEMLWRKRGGMAIL